MGENQTKMRTKHKENLGGKWEKIKLKLEQNRKGIWMENVRK